MSDFSVVWEDKALNLLDGRDRYTRNAIREQFRLDPMKSAIELDPAKRTFLTPVANSRFSVVWRLDERGEQALVIAVVPLTNVSVDTDKPMEPQALVKLKEYVQRAVAAESKGDIDPSAF
jgi:hypothetical protein